jgi:hypothetical protein
MIVLVFASALAGVIWLANVRAENAGKLSISIMVCMIFSFYAVLMIIILSLLLLLNRLKYANNLLGADRATEVCPSSTRVFIKQALNKR